MRLFESIALVGYRQDSVLKHELDHLNDLDSSINYIGFFYKKKQRKKKSNSTCKK